MLASVSETLLAKGLSIETVTTDLQLHMGGGTDRHRRAPRRRRRDFVIEADCVATKPLDDHHLQSLVEDLTHIKTELELDIVDVRVQRLSKEMQELRRYNTSARGEAYTAAESDQIPDKDAS